jgi:general secretion pathway protein A
MSYYRILGLKKEPFSTSPDPDFFYDSPNHHSILMRLMIEIRLKCGLSTVFGDVGVGKTTLSRKLFQMLTERRDIIFGMILDPVYKNEEMFLESLTRVFNLELTKSAPSLLDYKDALKNYLFRMGVEEGKTIVFLIDEAQKLNSLSLEVLRVLLNYETNEYKLLQVILLGQMELLSKLNGMRNLTDRINLKYILKPLNEEQTKEMIAFRLRQAGLERGVKIFTDESIAQIYHHTQGYPRRITMLCHKALKAAVMSEASIIDTGIINGLIHQENDFVEMCKR